MKGYPDYEFFKLDRPADRVLRITMSRGKVNAMNYQMHHDLTTIWPLVDADPDTSCAILPQKGARSRQAAISTTKSASSTTTTIASRCGKMGGT